MASWWVHNGRVDEAVAVLGDPIPVEWSLLVGMTGSGSTWWLIEGPAEIPEHIRDALANLSGHPDDDVWSDPNDTNPYSSESPITPR
jgi:hypothetical protein